MLGTVHGVVCTIFFFFFWGGGGGGGRGGKESKRVNKIPGSL